MAFPQKQKFVFKHFTTVFLSVLPTHFMHRLVTWSLVVRCLQNHPHFLTRSSYIPVRYVVRYHRKAFVWGEMYSYSFTSGKTYLVIQTWRIVKWATTWQNQQSDCAPSEDSDQPVHPPSLFRVFAVYMKKTYILSYPFSAQRRLWSDWADAQADLSSLGVHSFCWFWHVVAQNIKDRGKRYSIFCIRGE